jgi:hypothetical protein
MVGAEGFTEDNSFAYEALDEGSPKPLFRNSFRQVANEFLVDFLSRIDNLESLD